MFKVRVSALSYLDIAVWLRSNKIDQYNWTRESFDVTDAMFVYSIEFKNEVDALACKMKFGK